MGGAAIAATQVFGAIAGIQSASFANKTNFIEVSDKELFDCYTERFDKKGGGVIDISAAMSEIRKIMWESGAIVRTEERCISGINRIDEIESIFNPILHFEQCIDIKKVNELYSYINLSKILLKVMNYRKESRGPHYRRDFPDMDSSYNGRISVRKDGEGLEFSLI
ncbi:MAG: hypothetical protein GX854_01070 [Clostridiales bacterium]|nr:hypothetical protein [Clostridiales bacterium]